MVSATYNDSELTIIDGGNTIILNIDADLRAINTMLENGIASSPTLRHTTLLSNYKKARNALNTVNKTDPKINEIIEKLESLVNK